MTTSSYDRRLASVETALSPTQLVLRWLEEAHRYDDMTAYMRSLVDRPLGDFPMDRLSREAQESARIRSRGRSRVEVERAARRSLFETLVRGQLVLEINVRSQNWLDREGLIYLVLVGQVGLAVGVSDAPLEGTPLARLVQCRDLLLGRVTELHAFEAARDRVEGRYLDGAPADFPAARRAWAQQRDDTEMAAVMATRMAELDGADRPAPEDAATFEARVALLAADFVEPAKSKAYNELGDGRRAQAIAAAWLHAGLLAGTTPEPTR
jgi:hypothetical protein